MIIYKSLMTALCIIFVVFLSSPVMALDGEQLYVDKNCIACHGAEGRVPVMAAYPKIAGQNAPYMVAQMKDIKTGSRSHSHTAPMKNVMHLITDEEMQLVAEWLAKLPI